MKSDLTFKMGLQGLIMYCENNSFNTIQKHFRISSAPTLIRRTIKNLCSIYDLKLQKDYNSIGYLLVNDDFNNLKELAKKELSKEDYFQEIPLEEKVEKGILMGLIEEIHKERIELNRLHSAFNEKIINLERYINKLNK
ncbi:MAG TPA: hypothetical protein VFV31_12465 [Chitinophagaceae bacterium]|nr:hypothetical protein [Chitinophagaceae bacterium]